jgi:hypothetical protein
MRREHWSVIWDLPDDPDGNVQHIGQNGLSEDEVEEVLLDPSLPIQCSRSSGRPLRQGWTTRGRFITVVWDQIDPDTVRPVTAYEGT